MLIFILTRFSDKYIDESVYQNILLQTKLFFIYSTIYFITLICVLASKSTYALLVFFIIMILDILITNLIVFSPYLFNDLKSQ